MLAVPVELPAVNVQDCKQLVEEACTRIAAALKLPIFVSQLDKSVVVAEKPMQKLVLVDYKLISLKDLLDFVLLKLIVEYKYILVTKFEVAQEQECVVAELDYTILVVIGI